MPGHKASSLQLEMIGVLKRQRSSRVASTSWTASAFEHVVMCCTVPFPLQARESVG